MLTRPWSHAKKVHEIVLRAWGSVLLAGLLLLGAGDALAQQFVQGHVLAGVGAGQIKEFTPSGTLVRTLNTTSGSSETTGMCFDNLGNLYNTNFSTNSMAKFDNTGTLITYPWGSGFNQDPESCVYDGAGSIYVGQADGTRAVLKFNLSGTPQGSFNPTTGPRGTDWIDIAADGCTIYYTSEGSLIRRYNVCTSTQLSDFATGVGTDCYALRIRPNGEVMVACHSQVVRLNSSGVVMQSYPGSGFTPAESYLFAMNLDPDGTTFWTGGITSGQVYRINIATGTQVTSFNAGILGSSMAGLAVVGEITSIPTPVPTPAGPQPIPASSSKGLLVFIVILAVAGGLLLWRRSG